VQLGSGKEQSLIGELALMLTGIGGQGIQLGAQVLARAALFDGHEVMLFGSYGGMMRGGNTEATIVIGDGPLLSPPTVSKVDGAIVMHHEHAIATLSRLSPGSLVLVNETVFAGTLDEDLYRVFRLGFTALASEAGAIQSATMVALGAFSALSGVVTMEGLKQGIRASLPPYRQQHVDTNIAALTLGYRAACEKEAIAS
jgi:Pyruvate/2-oxoacid:ferredoxin oxidoreductase gamma subunit